jgi:hypothetical protein
MSRYSNIQSIATAAAVALLLALGAPARAQDKPSPTFDCAKETGAVEQAIAAMTSSPSSTKPSRSISR